MSVTLLTEQHLEFLSLKEAAEARPSLHLSKCQIVGNHVTAQFRSVIWVHDVHLISMVQLT